MVKPPSNRFAEIAVFCVVLAFCTSAQAAAVTNLTDAPQTITFEADRGMQEVTIAPGDTWRLLVRTMVKYKSHETLMGSNEEYAIWKDGTFGPQRANTRGGHNF